MTGFLFATDEESQGTEEHESMKAFVENLMGAVQSEQAPLLTEVVCSGMELAKESGWDAETTTIFIKEVVAIFIDAQSTFAHNLAS